MGWLDISKIKPDENQIIIIFYNNALSVINYNSSFSDQYLYSSTRGFHEVSLDKITYWMPAPNQPERSKRENSQCGMRCSELYENIERQTEKIYPLTRIVPAVDESNRLTRDMLAATASFINCTGGVNGDNPTEITRTDVDTIVRTLLNNNAYTIMDKHIVH